MGQVERIRKIEEIYDRQRMLTDNLRDALAEFQKHLPQYFLLADYYKSEQYMQDVDDSNLGLLPSNLKCGILSEDAVYNLLADQHTLALKMLKTATEMIEKY